MWTAVRACPLAALTVVESFVRVELRNNKDIRPSSWRPVGTLRCIRCFREDESTSISLRWLQMGQWLTVCRLVPQCPADCSSSNVNENYDEALKASRIKERVTRMNAC